jgi:hypothetical protein
MLATSDWNSSAQLDLKNGSITFFSLPGTSFSANKSGHSKQKDLNSILKVDIFICKN